jgi:hypothetical protein
MGKRRRVGPSTLPTTSAQAESLIQKAPRAS